ncbi:hypothetical protein [Agaribacterium haliotis]|uniref:hypothetical protein n=1 Tax=Agaribacterium haliotis TaxID=2013869 RepID=UPI000BB55D10|nr:hypothetical protein [Agaribacterium haliotis]
MQTHGQESGNDGAYKSSISANNKELKNYARWCYAQLSDDALQVLRETLWVFYIKSNSWLHSGIVRIFAYHLEPMVPRMHIAILRGKLDAELPAPDDVEKQARVIATSICELLQKGELNSAQLLNQRAKEHISRQKQFSIN